MISVNLSILSFLWMSMIACAAGAQSQDRLPLRSWTINDSIEVRYFVGDQTFPAEFSVTDENAIHPSPDGRHFFFVTRRGDLECDCNRYDLAVYDVSGINRVLSESDRTRHGPLRPVRLLTMSSAWSDVHASAIRSAQWENNSTILFRGVRQDRQPEGVFRFDVSSGTLERMTDEAHEVRSFALRGESIVYTAVTAERPRAVAAYPMTAIRGNDLTWMLSRNPVTYTETIFVAREKSGARSVASYDVGVLPSGPWLSPDGRFAVMSVPFQTMSAIPSEWAQYEGLNKRYNEFNPSELAKLRRFFIIDVAKGSGRPIIEAPVGLSDETMGGDVDVLWSPDSAHAILINAALPLTENVNERRRMGYVVHYDVQAERWSVIQPMTTPRAAPSGGYVSALTVGWLKGGRELLITHVTPEGHAADGAVYRMRAGRWERRWVPSEVNVPSNEQRQTTTLIGGLNAMIRQSENDAPVAVASRGRHEVMLTDPDPALNDVRLARIDPVKWSERGGHLETGGLLVPVEPASPPFPLVIQGSYYQRDRFRPDGSISTSEAAQALVAKGIAVLRIDTDVGEDHLETIKADRSMEGVLFVERIEAAIRMLSEKGLIDPAKVGLIGFSRSGFLAYYAVTHPNQVKLAAAIVADGWTGSYGEYVTDESRMGGESASWMAREFASQYDGSFWENKQKWLEHAPGFNVDRVEAPVLFVANGASSPLAITETLAAFRLNKREAEFMLFPSGNHQLYRPMERLASLETTVDWMTFWLQGREQAGEEKTERYTYWRRLRAQKDARLTLPSS